jgi:hypothetical protein
MICAMTSPLPDIKYSRELQEFAQTIQDKTKPFCRLCGLHHERVDYHPYCLTNRQFYAWLEAKKARQLHCQ